MDKKMNNKNMMYISTFKVLENYKSSWDMIPIFVILVAEFKSLLDRISATAIAAGLVLTGVTDNKNDTLLTLRKIVFSSISMLSLYAMRTRNMELHAKVSLNEGEVQKMRQNELLLFADQVAKWLEKYKKELVASYGLTDATIAQIKNQIVEFTKVMPEPEAKYSDKKAANEQLTVLFNETDQFIERQLDKAVDSFRESKKELYSAYNNARKIKNLGIRHETVSVNGASKKDTVS